MSLSYLTAAPLYRRSSADGPERQYAGDPRQGYAARAEGAKPRAQIGLPIPAASKRSSRKTRPGVRAAPESDLCSRMFLAFTQMQNRPCSEIESGILGAKAGTEQNARREAYRSASSGGLAGPCCLGVRSPR